MPPHLPTSERPPSFVHMYQPPRRLCVIQAKRDCKGKKKQRMQRPNALSSLQQPRSRLLDDISDPRNHLGGVVLVAGRDGVADRGEVLDLVAREAGAKDDVLELCAIGDLRCG